MFATCGPLLLVSAYYVMFPTGFSLIWFAVFLPTATGTLIGLRVILLGPISRSFLREAADRRRERAEFRKSVRESRREPGR